MLNNITEYCLNNDDFSFNQDQNQDDPENISSTNTEKETTILTNDLGDLNSGPIRPKLQVSLFYLILN